MADINKPCENCGCVKPHHDSIERAMNAKFELGQRFRGMSARHASELAYQEIQLIEAQEGMRWMQTKVRKQAGVIRNLEEKLRRLNQAPHADLPEEFTVTLMNGRMIIMEQEKNDGN